MDRRSSHSRSISAAATAALCFGLALASIVPAGAATYYVDKNNAACSDFGPGSEAAPFCTIGRGAYVAVAGDTVLVRSGTYPEYVKVKNSGTATAPIVIQAAPGASVLVTGQYRGLELSSYRSYVKISGFEVSNTTSYGIYVNGSSNTVSNCNVHDVAYHGIYVTGSGNTASGNTARNTGQLIDGQTRSGIYVAYATGAVISGNTTSDTTGYGIYVKESSSVTIAGNTVTRAGAPQAGFVTAGIRIGDTTDSTVSGNIADYNTDAGIKLTSNATRVTVIGNTTRHNARGYTRAAPGIDVRSGGNIIKGNISNDNEDSGIQVYPYTTGVPSPDNLILNNICYHNGDHGIDISSAGSQRVIGNTVFDNITAGINVEGPSSGTTLSNNIAVSNGLPTSFGTKGNIRVDNSSVPGTTIDYDLMYQGVPNSTMIVWGPTFYKSLAAMQAATGQEPHGLEADPLWVSAVSADFHLQPGSPAIDSADSGVIGQTDTDIEGRPRADDPAVPDTGAGPRTYDDRGAYERQP